MAIIQRIIGNLGGQQVAKDELAGRVFNPEKAQTLAMDLDFSKDLLAKRHLTLPRADCLPLMLKSQDINLPSIWELGISPNPASSPPSEPGLQGIRRHRVTPFQKEHLNRVFKSTFFPSTELRHQLALDLQMTPRAIQIWFQNKRQAWRLKNKPHHHNPM